MSNHRLLDLFKRICCGNTYTKHMHRRMKENTDSDLNPTMLASNLFDNIINNIRSSNLNFQLQMSAFSAQITLKRSLVTEKTGVPRLPTTIHAVNNFYNTNPSSEITAFVAQNVQLENVQNKTWSSVSNSSLSKTFALV